MRKLDKKEINETEKVSSQFKFKRGATPSMTTDY
jgi:hypothetical protein